MRRMLAGLGLVLVLARVGLAGTVRLPTDGYVREGRYFPVEVSSPVELHADGCVTTTVHAMGHATVPMLVASTPGTLLAGDQSLPLRLPGEHERLVGTTGEIPANPFPGERIIPIRLDAADPLPGPPAAWEVLHAIVLDPMEMARIDGAKRSALLAGGVVLAVAGDQVPDGQWPWKRNGGMWTLACEPAGPAGVIAEEAYAPSEMWTPAWPAGVRQAVVAAALALGLATVSVAAIARRRGGRWTLLTLAVPVAAIVATWAWRSRLDTVARGGGDVVVTSADWVQRDAWVYRRAREAVDLTVPWAGWTHPVFPSEAWPARARLDVGIDGTLAFQLPLKAGSTMAFVRREVGIGGGPTVSAGQGAMMRDIAPLYLSMGDRLLGESVGGGGRWPGVVIGRSR